MCLLFCWCVDYFTLHFPLLFSKMHSTNEVNIVIRHADRATDDVRLFVLKISIFNYKRKDLRIYVTIRVLFAQFNSFLGISPPVDQLMSWKMKKLTGWNISQAFLFCMQSYCSNLLPVILHCRHWHLCYPLNLLSCFGEISRLNLHSFPKIEKKWQKRGIVRQKRTFVSLALQTLIAESNILNLTTIRKDIVEECHSDCHGMRRIF